VDRRHLLSFPTRRSSDLDFTSIEAWHNYYPRPETGLDKLEFINMNKWLKEKGITVMAFVPGEGDLRGPLFEGLPTLEDHRYKHSLGSALELRSEEHTSELQSRFDIVCSLLLEK